MELIAEELVQRCGHHKTKSDPNLCAQVASVTRKLSRKPWLKTEIRGAGNYRHMERPTFARKMGLQSAGYFRR